MSSSTPSPLPSSPSPLPTTPVPSSDSPVSHYSTLPSSPLVPASSSSIQPDAESTPRNVANYDGGMGKPKRKRAEEEGTSEGNSDGDGDGDGDGDVEIDQDMTGGKKKQRLKKNKGVANKRRSNSPLPPTTLNTSVIDRHLSPDSTSSNSYNPAHLPPLATVSSPPSLDSLPLNSSNIPTELISITSALFESALAQKYKSSKHRMTVPAEAREVLASGFWDDIVLSLTTDPSTLSQDQIQIKRFITSLSSSSSNSSSNNRTPRSPNSNTTSNTYTREEVTRLLIQNTQQVTQSLTDAHTQNFSSILSFLNNNNHNHNGLPTNSRDLQDTIPTSSIHSHSRNSSCFSSSSSTSEYHPSPSAPPPTNHSASIYRAGLALPTLSPANEEAKKRLAQRITSAKIRGGEGN